MDPQLVTMLAAYMEKTGSVSAETRNLLDRMYRYIDKQDNTKTASAALQADRAGHIAQKMSTTRMLTGAPLIEGYDMIKQAAAMMTNHDHALDLLDMVLDSVITDRQKQASFEPGYGCSSSSNSQEMTAMEGLMAEYGVA